MKKLIALCLFMGIIFCTNLSAQTGTVSGVVSDDVGPLIGVSISVDGLTTGTITDVDGSYELSLDPGSYKIIASYVGYDSQSRSVSVLACLGGLYAMMADTHVVATLPTHSEVISN